MRRRKRLIIAASAVLLVLLAVGLFALHRTGVPQNYALDVAGEPGRAVVGTVTADGVSHKFQGVLPLKVEYRASRLEFAFAPADGRPDHSFAVHVRINGEESGRCNDPDGVKGRHERTGVPGWGIRGGGIGGLNAAEVAALTR